jgi:hypothetical protein
LSYGLVDRLETTKSTRVEFFRRGCLATALALTWLCGSQIERALAMQSPKIGTVICQPGSEIDPYSFWPTIRHDDVTSIIELKYKELQNVDDLASWIACRGFITTIRIANENQSEYILDAHFSRLKDGKYARRPLWGFDIPIFRGAWAYNIEIYFDKSLILKSISIKNLWN